MGLYSIYLLRLETILLFLEEPETATCSPEMIVSGEIRNVSCCPYKSVPAATMKFCVRSNQPWWNNHGSPWSNDARVLMKESATPSKTWEYLQKTSRTSPEERNQRKGLENQFKIDRKVKQQKTTQKNSKLTFFWTKWSFQCCNQPHMLYFDPKQSCAKEWRKKMRYSLSSLIFLMQKMTNQKKQKPAIKHTLWPQEGLLLPNNQPKM